jgi:hypothetical protein
LQSSAKVELSGYYGRGKIGLGTGTVNPGLELATDVDRISLAAAVIDPTDYPLSPPLSPLLGPSVFIGLDQSIKMEIHNFTSRQ